MPYVVIGLFKRYEDAEAAVSDLEQMGIEGEQVEVITDMDEDVRTANTRGEPSTSPQAPRRSWFERIRGARVADVRDESGDQPNYIAEQEFYATHVKQGGAVMVVHIPQQESANRAAVILRDHGAHSPGSKDAPAIRHVD